MDFTKCYTFLSSCFTGTSSCIIMNSQSLFRGWRAVFLTQNPLNLKVKKPGWLCFVGKNGIPWMWPPPRMPVTTRIITFLIGNPYKPLICHCYWEGATCNVYQLLPSDLLITQMEVTYITSPLEKVTGNHPKKVTFNHQVHSILVNSTSATNFTSWWVSRPGLRRVSSWKSVRNDTWKL